MNKRIQIDGKWYVEETIIPTEFDLTYSNQVESNMFDFMVCLNEDGSIMTGTETILVYRNGRFSNEYTDNWDSTEWLRAFRDRVNEDGPTNLDESEEAELRHLLKEVTKRGWL